MNHLVREFPDSPPTSNEVFRWSEFEAFAERLGIDHLDRTRKLVVTLEVTKLPVIEQTMIPKV